LKTNKVLSGHSLGLIDKSQKCQSIQRYCSTSKHWELFIWQCSITLQKTWISYQTFSSIRSTNDNL